MNTHTCRTIVLICLSLLVVLGLGWELWWAPLRPAPKPALELLGIALPWLPASWIMCLKVLPLVLALPAIKRGHVRSFQWWSMLILVYLTEGLVRATSDKGLSSLLAWGEVALATIAFLSILAFVRSLRPAPTVT